eukprot:4881792-Pleurochrysis_carterae.AAC.1
MAWVIAPVAAQASDAPCLQPESSVLSHSAQVHIRGPHFVRTRPASRRKLRPSARILQRRCVRTVDNLLTAEKAQ